MCSHIGVVPRRLFATFVALAFALCLLGTFAAAQVAIQPKDEIYAGTHGCTLAVTMIWVYRPRTLARV